MSGWQVVDTLQKKKEKLKQKHAENAIEAAAREKQRLLDQQERDAELKRLGLGFTITDVSTQHHRQPKKGKKGQGKSKQINAIYDLHIPSDDEGQKKKVKSEKNKDKQKKPKEPKEPKERKEKSNLAEACAGLDADALKTELKKIEIEYSSLPGVQLPKLAELLENSFPKVQPFNKHADGHLYKRIQSPLRTFQDNNEEVFTLILNWIGDRPVSGDFVTLLVDHLVDPHGSQGVGIRILLSILARYHPQRIVGESQYIIDRLPFRTATWIFLQTMYSDPDLALLLWVRHMLPRYIDDEKESPEAVVYLACLFTYIRKKGHRVHVPMPEGEFAALLGQFLVARATYPETNFNLIKDHYYELLDTSFITPKDPTKLFEELLELSTSSDSNVSNAAVDVLIYNLKANTELFRIWKEIYADHVVETNNLLVFIRRNYEHIQTSMLPPIVREAHTYASDVSSDDQDDDEEQDNKKKKGVLGASMELNGKTLHHSSSSPPSSSSSSSRKTHARSTPISVRELQLLLTRIEEINKELADVKRPKGKKAKEEAGNTKRVGKDTLNVCNATCQELRETMTQSKSGRERETSAVGSCVKGMIGVAGLIGVVGLALQYVYGYEALEQFLYNAK